MKDSRLERLAAELDEALAGTSDAPGQERGRVYRAKVAGLSGDDVIVELGPRVQGVVPLAELPGTPEPGASLEVVLRGREEGLWLFSARDARTLAAWDEMEVGSLVKGVVIGMNKGGLELKVGGLSAFLPASQIALQRVEDLASYAGESLVCEVLEIDRDRRRIVLSRRAVLEAEREARRHETVEALSEGSVVRGRVTRIEPFGAFLDLGGELEGLLHVSNISHVRIENPADALKVGDELEVLVLKIEEGGRRIGLGRKQLEADPWDGAAERFREGSVVQGKVVRLMEFGAFVEVRPGLEGLLHVSQLGAGRVRRVRDALRPGEEIPVRVLSIDPAQRRLSLSRLDERGALLGSDEAVDEADIARVLEREANESIGTNLGALFRKALNKD